MEFNRSFKDLNKRYGGYTLNFISSFIQCFPKVALDLMFVQINRVFFFFFSFSILEHLKSLRAFKPSCMASLGLIALFPEFLFLSLISHFISSSKKKPGVIKTLCLEISLARAPSLLGTFPSFHIITSEGTANICPLLQLLRFISHSFKSALSVFTKFKILWRVCSKHFEVFTNTILKILTVFPTSTLCLFLKPFPQFKFCCGRTTYRSQNVY